jgi:hypothetical protein
MVLLDLSLSLSLFYIHIRIRVVLVLVVRGGIVCIPGNVVTGSIRSSFTLGNLFLFFESALPTILRFPICTFIFNPSFFHEPL